MDSISFYIINTQSVSSSNNAGVGGAIVCFQTDLGFKTSAWSLAIK